MPPVPDQYWGTPSSTIDWCELNYEVSPFIAEFWNTISNLGMIIPPLFGIYEVFKLGLEKKFILTHIFLIVVGFGSWAFHMTLLWPMQLADELPMVWGNTILIYQLWEIRKSTKRPVNWLVILLCFTYCFFFTAVYLIFKNPLIHHGMYAVLVIVVLGLDLRLVKQNQCRTCTKLLSAGFFMYTLGFGIWNIDNQLCSMITDVRRVLPSGLRPWTQLHAWWHILAGYATYLHILFGIHARGHFVRPKTSIELKFYGFEPKQRSKLITDSEWFYHAFWNFLIGAAGNVHSALILHLFIRIQCYESVSFHNDLLGFLHRVMYESEFSIKTKLSDSEESEVIEETSHLMSKPLESSIINA